MNNEKIEFCAEKTWSFDIETYVSCFSIGFKNFKTKEYVKFEVSRFKNESRQLFEFMTTIIKEGHMTFSFNGMSFDVPSVHYFLNLCMMGGYFDNPVKLVSKIYEKSQWIIKFGGKFHRQRNPMWIDIDLFKINHFDNGAKSTSLKKVEAYLKMRSIQELPHDFHDPNLTEQDIAEVVDYMEHDVNATDEFAEDCIKEILFRFSMIERFGIAVLNYSDSKIGSEVMTRELIDKMGYDRVYTIVDGKRKAIQSEYDDGFDVKDLIFPYIKFETDPGKAILEFFCNQRLTSTKGVFNNLDLTNVGSLANHVEHVLTDTEMRKERTRLHVNNCLKNPDDHEFDKKGYPLLPHDEDGKPIVDFKGMGTYRQKYWDHLHLDQQKYHDKWRKKNAKGELVDCKETFARPTTLKKLNVVLGGLTHDLGTGGIHSFCGSGIYRSCEKYQILDIDVASYYVAMQIVNYIGASHYDIDVWVDTLKELKKTRETYDKSDPLNKASKIAQLSIYGNYGNEFSNLKDLKTLAQICINGQLSLLMLTEILTEEIPELKILSLNTDGISLAYRRDTFDKLVEKIETFEEMSGLLFEAQEYNTIIQPDINSYIWMA